MARLTKDQAARLRTVLVGGCYVILAAAAGWTLHERKGNIRPVMSAIYGGSPDAGQGSGLLVTILLQPEDCDTQITALRLWNDVARRGKASVRGVVLSGEPNAAAAVATNIGAAFPFVTQPSPRPAAALRSLGYTSTPIVLISDASRQVRFVAPIDHVTSIEQADRLLKEFASPAPPRQPVPVPGRAESAD
jgi:hypothetical protein